MPKTAIITDSNAHITAEEAKELGIGVVPMPFMIGDETYYEGITLICATLEIFFRYFGYFSLTP